jgi:hypothetical protein
MPLPSLEATGRQCHCFTTGRCMEEAAIQRLDSRDQHDGDEGEGSTNSQTYQEIYEPILARLTDHQAGGLYRSQIRAAYGHCDRFIADERGFAPIRWAISMITGRTAMAAA